MEADQYKELHKTIERGDGHLVRGLLQNHSEGQYYSHEGTSALFKAFFCGKYEIASYLIHRDAKIHASEVLHLYTLEIDLTRLNCLLLEYQKDSEMSCLFRLISSSHSPQGLDGEKIKAVMFMYKHLFESKSIRPLMNVLINTRKPFDVVYDFGTEDVDMTPLPYVANSDILALTLTKSPEILIGAKDLLTADSQKRAEVYGVVAQKFCRLTIDTIYEYKAKIRMKGVSRFDRDLPAIVQEVTSLTDLPRPIKSVIKDVLNKYNFTSWDRELIARVPHVIAVYGEEYGRSIFHKCPELARLLDFYDRNILPKFREYTDAFVNTKSDGTIKQLMRKNLLISFTEKKTRPLKEDFPSFREYVVVEEGVSVISTNCTKLCTLHVYHELKPVYGDQLERKCIFFVGKCFEKKRRRILDALKCKFCEYLILVVGEEQCNLQRLSSKYIDHLKKLKSEGMNVIIISGSKSLGQRFESRALNYNWSDLTDEFKDIRTRPVKYVFRGEPEYIFLEKEGVPYAFGEKDMIRIMSGDVIEVNDGGELSSNGYTSGTYVEREFRAMTVDAGIFESLPEDTNIYLSGLSRTGLQELSINENLVQWIHGSEDEIQVGKSIFIITDVGATDFENFVRKNAGKTCIWLHHDDQEFILRSSNLLDDVFQQYLKQETLSEKKILDFLVRKSFVIISGNAGCGKSTVMSSLLSDLKKNNHSRLRRIDFNKFSDEKDPISLANMKPESGEENALDHLYLMLGINRVEEKLFRKCSMDGRCFLFIDGLDKILSKYKNNAFKILSAVKNKTHAKVVLTTRKQNQRELEVLLNSYSHELVPFSRETQIRYLGNLWKWKLKYPNGEGLNTSHKDENAVPGKIQSIIQQSKRQWNKLDQEYTDLVNALKYIKYGEPLDVLRSQIEELDLTKLAEKILGKCSLDKETLQCMGIPLYLYMLGIIRYAHNFNVEIKSDIHSVTNTNLDELLNLCITHLAKGEIEEMLLANQGGNRKHRLGCKHSPEIILKNWNLIVDDDDCFKKLLMSRGQSGKNIFHLASEGDIHLKDIFRFCDAHLDKQEILELLISCTENGNNVIHLCVLNNSPETLIKNLLLIKEVSGDAEYFKGILMSEGQSYKNIFHLASGGDTFLRDLMLFCDSHLDNRGVTWMLTSRTEYDNNVIHLCVLNNSPETLIRNLILIKEVLDDDEMFKRILMSGGQSDKNILQFAAVEDKKFEDLVRLCGQHLEKDELNQMLLDTDEDGDNVIHVLASTNSSASLIANLKVIEEILSEFSLFNRFLKSKGKRFRNVFHSAASNENGINLSIFNTYLSESEKSS